MDKKTNSSLYTYMINKQTFNNIITDNDKIVQKM